MGFATLAGAFRYLEGFANFEKKSPAVREYSLDRMRALLEATGNPHREGRFIHVAGSKGKGSTCAFTAALLAAAGCRVGIYASPHVRDWRERIRGDGGFYPDGVYLETVDAIRELVDGPGSPWRADRPTTFELLTLTAFLVFRRMAPDWVVLETGLGGRLDATNVVTPRLCIITDLELEHTEVLGPTLTHIAREKAGIFKPGVPVCTQEQAPEARKVLEDRAGDLGCPLRWASPPPDPAIPAGTDPLRSRNLSLALQGFRMLAGPDVPVMDAGVLAGAVRGILTLPLPGRMEWMTPPPGSDLPRVLVDAGHTPSSVTWLVRTVEAWKHTALHRPLQILSGIARDKDARTIASLLGSLACPVTVTRPGTFKESDPEGYAEAFHASGHPADCEPDTLAALDHSLDACRACPPGLLVACGSFYLAGIVMEVLEARGYTTEETS